MKPIAYDSEVLNKVAAALYAQAQTVEVLYAAAGLGVGVVGGYASQQMLASGSNLAVVAVVALVGTLLGVVAARSKALALRAQAQTLLCQVQIEQNTRPNA